MSDQKVAIVTGGNKGIGNAIVKGLCKKFNGVVYLTARDKGRGEAAVRKLKELNLNPSFHQLDIDDEESIAAFKNYILNTYGGIDVLVNNAAIMFSTGSKEHFGEEAEATIRTNYYGTARICKALFPLLRPNARVVNVSSSLGHLSNIQARDLRKRFSNPALTVPELDELMNEFVKAAKENKHSQEGWGYSPYNVSKVGVSALTIILQRDVDANKPDHNIQVNHVHPGYVDTDMTNHKGPLSVEEGATAPLYLAVENHKLKGQYVLQNCRVSDWYK